MPFEALWKWVERDWAALMTARAGYVVSLLVVAAAAFSLSQFIDGKELSAARTDRDGYKDCLDQGMQCEAFAAKAPVPKTVRIRVPTADPAQAQEISSLKARLVDAEALVRRHARDIRIASPHPSGTTAIASPVKCDPTQQAMFDNIQTFGGKHGFEIGSGARPCIKNSSSKGASESGVKVEGPSPCA